MSEYKKSGTELTDLVEHILEEHGNVLDKNIGKANIAYMYSMSATSRTAGRIQRPDGAWRLLTDYDYVMIVHKATWNEFDTEKRKALIFHELMHIISDDDDRTIKWKLREHDVEEFIPVVKEYGLWTDNLKAFGNSIERYKHE